MESEITFLVSYQCPRCRAALTAETEQWSTWLRCPKCGRPGLPPDYTAVAPRPRPKAEPTPGVFVIGPDGSPGVSPVGRPADRRRSSPGLMVRRLVLVTGLFVSALFVVFSLLDQNRVTASIAAFAGLACIGFLLLPSKR